jgi:hypothetical protein
MTDILDSVLGVFRQNSTKLSGQSQKSGLISGSDN